MGAFRKPRCLLAAATLVTMAVVPCPARAWTPADLPGGDIRSLAVDPRDPDHLLAGTASGQVFVSRDGADGWTTAGETLPFRGWVVSDLLFDLERPGRVWAALRGLHSEAGFVALSDDAGRTWTTRSGGLPERQVYALASAPGVLYAATRQGVFASRDEGRDWRHLTADYPEIQKVTSLLVDREEPQRLFAGTWRRAYRSDDGGATWRGVFDGMVLDSEVFSLTAVPAVDGELWASTCGWVYRSRDAGRRWVRFQSGMAERRTPSFQALPGGGKLAGTVAGVYRSDSDGASWHLVTPQDLVALVMTHHPDRPERVFVGSEGAGVWRSQDGGRSFEPASRGMNAARIAALVEADGEVLAAVRHSGPASGVYSSFDGGRTYPQGPAKMPQVSDLVRAGSSVFAATSGGLFERHSAGWRRVEEIGQRAVYELAAHGDRVAVRTASGLFLKAGAGARFAAFPFDRGRPRSVAIDAETMWVSTSERLYRYEAGGPIAAASPLANGQIDLVAGTLMLAGEGELWMRRAPRAAWEQLGRGMRYLATGDAEHPLLLVEPGGTARLLAHDGSTARRIQLAHPPEDVSAALLRDRRMILGTSSYGLLLGDLEVVTASLAPRVVGSAE